MKLSPLNPIPEDTRHAALSIYSPNQPYMTIGDHDRSFLKKLDFSTASIAWEKSEDILTLLSLVTIFQYAERLSDQQAAQATSERVDWKYALHLPLSYPGIAPSTLCMFRQWVAASSSSLSNIRSLVAYCSLMGLSLEGSYALPEPLEIIEVNCLKNCLDFVINLFLPAIEVLASEHPDWLKQVSQPHWVARYMAPYRNLFQAFSREELIQSIFSLERDIEHLIKVVDNHPEWNLSRYAEVQALLSSRKQDRLSKHHSLPSTEHRSFRLDCSTCIYPQQIHLYSH